MKGIYIHIPFCKQACRYCDFYFTISRKYTNDFLKALEKEIVSRAKDAGPEKISTLYFGGGTPSVLTIKQLQSIVKLVLTHFSLKQDAEITLEANPDDLPGIVVHR